MKRERTAVHLAWPRRKRLPAPPWLVMLIRISPSTRPVDDDNLVGALKSVRDQVATELGVDDGDRARIRFAYGQERGSWGVRIEVAQVSKHALLSHPAKHALPEDAP